MSLNLSNVILHQLHKNESEELVVKFREQSLKHDAFVENLVSELHRVFNAKAAKGFGMFKAESQFKHSLEQHRAGEVSFQAFSELSATKLKDELSKYPFAEAGILVMAQYQALATEYLLIALLPTHQSLKVTEGLDISATDYLDINKMDIVARIDITTHETNLDSTRYLSFIKGRVGRKVSDFFLDFLQADVGLDPKQQNQVLMQVVDDFCSEASFEKEETLAFKKQVHAYCNEQLKSGEEVELKALSQDLPTSDQGSHLYDYATINGYELEDSFPADRATVRKLTKFVGAGGGVNISFDSQLLGERIVYDPASDTLTIKGTPPNLREQLNRKA